MHDDVIGAAAADNAAIDRDAQLIALRRRVLEWRDAWCLDAEVRLTALCREKAVAVGPWAAGLWVHQLAAARAGFIKYPAMPQIVEEVGARAEWIVGKARVELTGIVAHHLEIETRAGRADAAADTAMGQVLAIGRGAAPFAAAAALLAVLPGLATTTTVTMFGLVTTSTVSLPVLAIGAAGVGALGYFGVINVGEVRSGQERVLIEAIEAAIEARLLASENKGTEPSLLAQVQKGFAAAAADVIGRIK
ncbi:hypothetical protein [Sphingomonas prati]|uniref:Uncharacterized protein n=1 Tax=Sphingomonas prati TaxID=1843237 RepID=A0A7W9F2P6_9SPHN|nr:hypothetical protein [Sphingomonas prati]MBB5730608.1 hypothetical protein [Sphingomonas prati]GGE95339.1 hypothetical protein GCM10011404_30600 [Sphingomonas prati]